MQGIGISSQRTEVEQPLFAEEDELPDLRPLPSPNFEVLVEQYVRGVAVVEGAGCAGSIGVIHLLAWFSEPLALWSCLCHGILVQATIAIICHVAVMLVDPGSIERSRSTCLPIPPAIDTLLRAGAPLDGLDNIRGDDDATYCVRCMVWRKPPPSAAAPERATKKWTRTLWRRAPSIARRCPCAGGKRTHHCSVCARCCVDFDHHCGVLGRCIGGGNMPYFIPLVTMAHTTALSPPRPTSLGTPPLLTALGATWQVTMAHTAALSVIASCVLALVQRYGATGGWYALGGLGTTMVVASLFTMWCVTSPFFLGLRSALRWLLQLWGCARRPHTRAPAVRMPVPHASWHDHNDGFKGSGPVVSARPISDETASKLPVAVATFTNF